MARSIADSCGIGGENTVRLAYSPCDIGLNKSRMSIPPTAERSSWFWLMRVSTGQIHTFDAICGEEFACCTAPASRRRYQNIVTLSPIFSRTKTHGGM
ncbi:hypothetical protein DO72_2080 [Burkholderia pseudomallei]|nr:hypothetical protein DO72_2080 [Burkholderia pseudomallei]